MNGLPGPYIRLAEATICLDCNVVFSSRDVACPTCAAVIGLIPVQTDAPAKEIARLRDREAWCTAALMQIARGLHASHWKAKIARRALEYLANDDRTKTKTASELPEAAQGKGVN